jgi:hypothetical protein
MGNLSEIRKMFHTRVAGIPSGREMIEWRRSVAPDVLPHWSRFVSQTGVAAFGGEPDIKWLNRLEPVG